MTDTETIADVVVAAVRASTAPLMSDVEAMRTRMAALELLAPVPGDQGPKGEQGLKGDKGDKGDPGPTGEAGASGVNGTDGRDGKDGSDAAVGPIMEDVARLTQTTDALTVRLVAIENRAEPMQLSPESILPSAEDCLRKEFATFLEMAPRRVRKNIIRDVAGRIVRVDEESLA